MTAKLATQIDITANDRATAIFQKIGEEADRTASRLLGMGAATSRALSAAGLDVGDTGLGKFAQQASYLTSQVSTLRKAYSGTFAEIKSGLTESIGLLTRDTQAYVTNTQAVIANNAARLADIDRTVTANKNTISAIEGDSRWKWMPELRDTRADRLSQNNKLLKEREGILRTLEKSERALADVTAAGSTRMAAFSGAIGGLKTAGSNLIGFLGGPWGIGIAGAVAAVGYLATAESDAEKAAKAYGTTLEDIEKRYLALVSGADAAAAATLKHSAVYQQARQQWATDLLQELQQAQKEIEHLLDEASGLNNITGMTLTSLSGFDAGMLQGVRSLIAELQTGGKTAQEAHIKFESLRSEWEKTGIPKEFAALLKNVGVQLDFIARNADTAKNALSELAMIGFVPTDSQLYVQGLREANANLDKLFDKTDQGRKQRLEAEMAAAKALHRETGDYRSAAVLEQAQKALDDFDKRLNRSTSRSGSGGADKTASAIRQVNDEIARLTMTAEAFEQHNFDKKLSELATQGVPGDLLKHYNEVFNNQRAQKVFDEATRSLQDFDRAYQQAFLGQIDLTRSISAEMDGFRLAAEQAYRNGVIPGAQEYEAVLGRIDELHRDRVLQSATDMLSGAQRGFRNFARDAGDQAKNMESLVTGSFSSIGQAFSVTTEGMKFSWQSALDSILNQSLQMLIVNPLLSGLSSRLGGLFGTFGSVGGGAWSGSSWSGGYDWGLSGSLSAIGMHSGGSVGVDATFTRPLPAWLVAEAPRYHTGGPILSPDERVIIAQTGERVLSRSQNAAYERGGNAPSVVNNITIEPPAGYQAQESRRANAGGGEDIRVSFSHMMAGEVDTYGSPLNAALQRQGLRQPVVRKRG